MTSMELIELAGHDPETVVKFSEPQFDEAAIGITDDVILVYDYDLMVEQLSRDDGIGED